MKYEERHGSSLKNKESQSKAQVGSTKASKAALKNAGKTSYQQYYFNVKSDLDESAAATSLLSSMPASGISIKKKDVETLLKNLNKENTQRLIDLEKKMRSITILFAGQDTFYKEFNNENIKDTKEQGSQANIVGKSLLNNRDQKKTEKPSCSKKAVLTENTTTSGGKQSNFTDQNAPLTPERIYKVPRRKQYIKVNDPVQLHQYYQQEWANFGSRIPGNKPSFSSSKTSLRNKFVRP